MKSLVLVTPVLDDWSCLAMLAREVSQVFAGSEWQPTLVAVDDGSRATPLPEEVGADVILVLTRNVGHQRAIAAALDWVVRTCAADAIGVLDADGEDRPGDLPRLLGAMESSPLGAAVGQRRRRSEGVRFVAFYTAYKAVFRLLAGEILDFGNFCVIGPDAARRLCAMHELWLNFPACLLRSRIDLVRVPVDRGRRYGGSSRMNLVGLVAHGLSAVAVFSDRALTRILLVVAAVSLTLAGGAAAAVILKLAGLATPGWLTTIALALLIVLVQLAGVALSGLFVIFGNAAAIARAPVDIAGGLIREIRRRNV